MVKPTYELWTPGYAYIVPSLTAVQLEHVIQDKEARIPRYLERCDAIWLLLVTDTGMPSSPFDIGEEINNMRFRTAFDRIFLMLPAHQQLIELAVQSLT